MAVEKWGPIDRHMLRVHHGSAPPPGTLYIFKCMNNAAPSYLVDLISLQGDKYTARRQRLRSSSDTTRLFVPRSRKRAGDSSFLAAAPKLWNELPVYLRESESVPAFRRALKTHLFSI